MNFLKKSGFSLFLLLIAHLAHPISVNAQEAPLSTSLGVSPAIVERLVTGGSSSSNTVEVFNLLDVPLPIRSFVTSLPDSNNENYPKEKQEKYDASTWIQVAEPDFILAPHGHRTFNYLVKVPDNAGPGMHYSSIFFEPLVPQAAAESKSLSIASRVGVILFLSVPGESLEKISINSLEKPFFPQSGPIPITLTLNNEGNLLLRPKGEVSVYDISGKKVFSQPLGEDLILPESEKVYHFKYGNLNTIGVYRVKAAISYRDSHAESGEQHPETKYYTFWVIPYFWSLVCGLFSLIPLNVLFRYRRRLVAAGKILFERN